MLSLLGEDIREQVRTHPQDFIDAHPSPTTSEEIYALAMAHDKLGQKKNAEHLLRLSLQKNFQFFPSLYALALRAFEKSRDQEGQNLFRRAIRLDQSAGDHSLAFQKELKFTLTSYERACRLGRWCLEELEQSGKATLSTSFQLGKILFEQSKLNEAIPHLKKVVRDRSFAQEAGEYLSYIYEHLFRGEELILKTLELAEEIPLRSDLFFNLAMVCQHEQNRSDLALHFFYLASREDPHDPGLRFSLEQASLEVISQIGQPEDPQQIFLLMLAHLYQGSVGVARRYAQSLVHLKFPDSFHRFSPEKLWRSWLLKDEGPLGQSLRTWFSTQQPRIDPSKLLLP